MKRILSLLLFLFVFICSKSQVCINHKNLNADSSIHYFEVTHDGSPGLFNSINILSVDYGEYVNSWSKLFCDAQGKKIKFRSGIELLNFITNNGWKLIDRHVIASNENRDRDHSTVTSTTVYLLFERN